MSSEFEHFLKDCRLTSDSLLFHIKSTVDTFRVRKLVLLLAGRNQLHICLASLILTRIRQPTANPLASRDRIRIYGQRVGNAYPASLSGVQTIPRSITKNLRYVIFKNNDQNMNQAIRYGGIGGWEGNINILAISYTKDII